MVNHRKNFSRRDCTVECNGVPMFFVHVVSGRDGGILFPKFNRAFRVALQVNGQRMSICHDEDENFPVRFKHKNVFIEGEFLSDFSLLFQTVCTNSFQIQLHYRLPTFFLVDITLSK